MIRVTAQNFEGPLDLLLKLIEDEKMDITTVSLAKITDEYLGKVRELELRGVLPLKELAEFLEVGSRLVYIKSKSLLPQLMGSEDDELSALELEIRLREYKRFKKSGQGLKAIIAAKRFSFDRVVDFEAERFFSPPPKMSLKMLADAFGGVLGELAVEESLEKKVVESAVSLEEKIDIIAQRIKDRLEFCLHHLYTSGNKTDIVVTFLALLELLKQRSVTVEQDELFAEIKVTGVPNG